MIREKGNYFQQLKSMTTKPFLFFRLGTALAFFITTQYISGSWRIGHKGINLKRGAILTIPLLLVYL